MDLLASFGTYTYNYNTTSSSFGAGWLFILIPLLALFLGLAIFEIVAVWRVYEKAGKPGWACLVPIYNIWVLAEIAGKPGWWGLAVLLSVIPVVGTIITLIVMVVLSVGVARNFGKSDVFGVVGLWLFSAVGFPILAFSAATYRQVNGPVNTPTVQ
ncbi:MAG TPA: DUF5684 domain-containing protein [Candidatus Saccharimonadales bacterium]|nr:DUF5684 domain-containing protein [Candidatus Saccharimonadales bacterium]